MNYWLILVPIVGAFIGWFTNRVIIKSLFHPRSPRKILGFTFHGIIPKSQPQIAVKFGKLASDQLLTTVDALEQKITSVENLKKLMPIIDQQIDEFLQTKIKSEFPFVSMFIGTKTINKFKEAISRELEILFPKLIGNYIGNLKQDIDLEKIISEKINSFPLDKLEAIINQDMAKGIRSFEIVGALAGFLIGIVSILITLVVT